MSQDAQASATHVVTADEDGDRLVDIVRGHLVVVASREIGPAVGRGAIRVDGSVGRINDRVSAGSVLAIEPRELSDLRRRGRLIDPEHPSDVAIAHNEDGVIVVDKPAGMHVHPMGGHRTGTLLAALLWHVGARPDMPWAGARPLPAHRLDRATSGLNAFVTDADLLRRFQTSLEQGQVQRTYEALVEGVVAQDTGAIDAALGVDPNLDYRRAVVPVADGGKPARTSWRVVERGVRTTRLEVTIDTGRTHQIRAHLASIGHRVVDDLLYDGAAQARSAATRRIWLRAVRLAFPHPSNGRTVDVVVPGLDHAGSSAQH